MDVVTKSLWLPVGRANFFSTTSDRSLIVGVNDDGSARCCSPELSNEEYIPYLRASVMRRVLEVLPRSFGYSEQGSCTMSAVSVTALMIASVVMNEDSNQSSC